MSIFGTKYTHQTFEKLKNASRTFRNKDSVKISILGSVMAVGVAFASYLSGHLSLTACYALSIGIAIQNFPEGSVISFPLLKKGYTKKKAFYYGFISGIFELLGTIVTLLFTNVIVSILPYMLAIAAGAMIYVIVIELIPESSDKSKLNVIGFLIGFILMMVLDVMLG